MSECNLYRERLELILTGEGVADTALEEHLAECSQCSDLYDFHLRLQASDGFLPDDRAFSAMRTSVLHQLQDGQVRTMPPQEPVSFPKAKGKTWLSHVLVAAAAAVVGFLGNQLFQNKEKPVIDDQGYLLEMVRRDARLNVAFQDSVESPISYRNITMEEADGDQVNVGFDVVTHMQVSTHKNDPLMKELLVQSLMSPVSLNERLEAINKVEEVADPKVRQALIHAMKNDPSPAVRMKALSMLVKKEPDAALTEALKGVLENEESVQIRMAALDVLVGRMPNQSDVQHLLEELEARDDRPLIMRVKNQTNY